MVDISLADGYIQKQKIMQNHMTLVRNLTRNLVQMERIRFISMEKTGKILRMKVRMDWKLSRNTKVKIFLIN